MWSMIPLALLALAGVTAAQCDAQCGPVGDLINRCNLPGFDNDWHSITLNSSTLNLTGLPDNIELEPGPLTFILSSYDDASCLCTEGVSLFETCIACGEPQSSTSSAFNQFEIVNTYAVDCGSFGYFNDHSLGEPSTTITSLPTATAALDRDGCQVCEVIEAQLAQCGLISLYSDPSFDSTAIETDTYQYNGYFLLNRTASQCFCTLPVLHSIPACEFCISDNAGDTLFYYLTDCNGMGYWTGPDIVPVTSSRAIIRPTTIAALSSSTSHSSQTSTTPTVAFTGGPGQLNSATRPALSVIYGPIGWLVFCLGLGIIALAA
jgi:hypothetical protein